MKNVRARMKQVQQIRDEIAAMPRTIPVTVPSELGELANTLNDAMTMQSRRIDAIEVLLDAIVQEMENPAN